MRVYFKSTQFLERLQQLKENAKATSNIKATLYVPDELMWWIFLEYGTGARGDNPTGGYTIEPVHARLLRFFRVITGEIEVRESVYTLGIPAFHMVTLIEEKIQNYTREFVRQSLKKSNYNVAELKQKFMEEAAPRIKDMVIESYHENLPNHIREFGRMAKTAAEAMEAGLEIREGE